MLHRVPDSTLRNRMLRIVVIQRRLVRDLCTLPPNTIVDLAWLQLQVWPKVDDEWVRRFWELNNGQRQEWIGTVALAETEAKQELIDIMHEQHRFKQLYNNPPSQRMKALDAAYWRETTVREAMKKLMNNFYDPLFYEKDGYPESMHGGNGILKRTKLAEDSRLKVCPYSDSTIQSPQLDHFYPKDTFPFICIHPDNLIPVGSDVNKIKSTTVPLDLSEDDQAANWFHPRWRCARDRFQLRFDEQQDHTWRLEFEPVDPADVSRVTNMEQMLQLEKFWGKNLEDDIRQAQKEIVDELRSDTSNGVVTIHAIEILLEKYKTQSIRGIQKWPLYIYRAALFGHIREHEGLVADTFRQFQEDHMAE